MEEWFGFFQELGWKVVALVWTPVASLPIFDGSILDLAFFQPGKELISGKNILEFFDCRFLICCCIFGVNRLEAIKSYSSMVPRDLSLRNKF